jgi:hypothetical protein
LSGPHAMDVARGFLKTWLLLAHPAAQESDPRSLQFRAKRAGVLFLDVSLVYHPGWEIEHPLEAAGRALRL